MLFQSILNNWLKNFSSIKNPIMKSKSRPNNKSNFEKAWIFLETRRKSICYTFIFSQNNLLYQTDIFSSRQNRSKNNEWKSLPKKDFKNWTELRWTRAEWHPGEKFWFHVGQRRRGKN